MDVSTAAFTIACRNMDVKLRASTKTDFENRAKEYLMCRSGFHVEGGNKIFPPLGQWSSFKENKKINLIRETAVKFAVITSGKTKVEIAELIPNFFSNEGV